MKIVFNFHLGAGGGEGHLIPHKISARNSNYKEPYEAWMYRDNLIMLFALNLYKYTKH